MRDPLGQDSTEMPLVEWNQPIETFTTRGTDYAFAKGVRLRYRRWCLPDTQSHRAQRQIHVFRVNAVSIVHNEGR
jgi:hypothetical protein